jgi:CRP/FNR family transcriptional regulator
MAEDGMRDKEVYSQLRRGAWFGEMPPSLAKTLFEAGRMEEYGIGETIYSEGMPAQGLFAILSGAVHLEKADEAGGRVLLHVASPGFWFGEVAVGGGLRTMVTATAYVRSQIWRVPVLSVARILGAEPELFSALSKLMALRLAALMETIFAMRQPSAAAQIAGRLALMDKDCKFNDSAVVTSVLQMTQGDLALMTGHVRQTVNAAVKQLEQDGLIKVGHRQIEICDTARLAAYSSIGA